MKAIAKRRKMPVHCSYDLRKKVANVYYESEKKTAICRLKQISHNTLDLLLKREPETRDFKRIAKSLLIENCQIQKAKGQD